jgi:hypothetical protein
MIYTLVGTHTGLREKGNKEISLLGVPAHHIYHEQVSELRQLIDATSLFGDTIIVTCIQLGEVASSKEHLISLLKDMESSFTIFVIDEPFADSHLVNRLAKVSKKLYDAREEKIKDDSIFTLSKLFVARNKKDAWIQFLDIKKRESGEAIQGVLWWKFQTEWQKVREGRTSIFTLEDCERIGGDLVRSTILAHRGEKDLMLELERIILSL